VANRLKPIIQTKPIPESKPSTTILILRGSQTTLDCEPSYYNSCTLYRGLCLVSTHSDFITFWILENLHVGIPTKAQTHFLGVWPGDHYLPLQKFTLDSMTRLANVSTQRCLLHHAVYRYSHTLHCTTEQGTLPKAILICQQAIPYQTHGGIVCSGWSTPKNRSLANLSKKHPQTMKVTTFPTVS
jgi:hypothetical protein